MSSTPIRAQPARLNEVDDERRGRGYTFENWLAFGQYSRKCQFGPHG